MDWLMRITSGEIVAAAAVVNMCIGVWKFLSDRRSGRR